MSEPASVRAPDRRDAAAIALLGAALAGLVLWVHAGWLHRGGVLGAPGTDVFRAAWGLDHQVRSLPGLPFWTDDIAFPEGVKVVILPMISTIWGAPLHALFGPITGYGAWVLALLWASAFATALLARALSGSTAAGLLAGAAMTVQPMMLLAVTDGTPEYVALWSMPAALLATWLARREAGLALPVIAGLSWAVVALDSPYHAVFALPFLPIAVWGMSRRNLLVFGLAGLFGGLAVLGAYWGLPVGDVEDQRRGGNAVQLFVWNQWESGQVRKAWDYTLAPGFVPVATIAGAVALALLRPLRSLPWLLVAALCFAFALGDAVENAQWAARAHGETAGAVARAVASFNESVHVPVVRFPRRWLVPAALALGVAAAIGLSRLPWELLRLAIALPAAAATVHHTLTLTRYREALPRFDAPTAEFARFIEAHDAAGAVLALPTIRAAKTAAVRREDIPIWAELDEAIRSADQIWIQLATGRPNAYYPQGMRTIVRRTARDRTYESLIRDLDDLTLPQTTGNAIPPSATMEPQRRAAAAARLVDRGLRFVALDAALYGPEGLALAKLPFAERIVEERTFEDGTGVVVWVVE